MNTTRRWAATALGLSILAGCKVSTNVTLSLTPQQLEAQATKMLKESGRTDTFSVKCPQALTGRIGDSQRCVLNSAERGRMEFTVTTTQVEGRDIHFFLKEIVDSIPQRDLEQYIVERLSALAGKTVAAARCQGDLKNDVGARVPCQAQWADGSTHGVTMAITFDDTRQSEMRYKMFPDMEDAELRRALMATLAQHDKPASAVDCAQPLGSWAGATTRCLASLRSGDKMWLTIRTTGLKPDGTVKFDIRQDG